MRPGRIQVLKGKEYYTWSNEILLTEVYSSMTEKAGGNTIDEYRRNARIKYKQTADGIFLQT
jgi:hypothetical protein